MSLPPHSPRPRLGVRALIRDGEDRLLLVNAFAGRTGAGALWCAPGGGVELGDSLPDTLIREVAEETGLIIAPGPLALVSEFYSPEHRFHQVDLFFHAQITGGALRFADPSGVVSAARWLRRADLDALPHKPAKMAAAAWAPPGPPLYQELEPMLRQTPE